MPVPQVNERMKRAPAQALRAVFAGIGQMLSMTDKLRGKSAPSPGSETVAPETVVREPTVPEPTIPETVAAEPDVETVATETIVAETAAPETAAPETAAPETAAPETAAPETAAPETAAPETAAPETAAPQTAAPEEAPTTAGGHVKLLPPEAVPAAATVSAAPANSTALAAELPLANYDELTIPSLRARLRNLSADQLGQLIEYEKGHAARSDVITMFERRIAKLAEA
jgi:hypothetical protein